jgi:DNA topoisomerase-2
MRGVPRNTWNLSIKEVIQNKEMENIIKILGLRLSDKDSKDCTFENILIASDADSDGSHICGVILAFFLKYCKWMFTDGKIKRLRTPVILLKHKDKVIKFFFNLNEYNDYIKKHDVSKYDLKYVKGLGGFNKAEMRQIIEENGFDHFVQTYEYDESQFKIVDDWVSESTSDNRKEMLRNNNFNIFGM